MDGAFMETRRLLRQGTVLFAIAVIAAIAIFFVIIFSPFGSNPQLNSLLVTMDYVVTLGIACPGLTLFLVRLYTDRGISRGDAKIVGRKAKLALVSISWVILAIVLILTRLNR